MTTESRHRATYVAGDFLMTVVAMIAFNVVRYELFVSAEEGYTSLHDFLLTTPVIFGELVIPVMMLGIYYISGAYYDVVFRSRVEEFFNTLITTGIGALLIYFILVVNDPIVERGEVYELTGSLWLLLFAAVYTSRLMITLFVVRRASSSRDGYPTLIVGTTDAAKALAERLNRSNRRMGFNVVGYVDYNDDDTQRLDRPVYRLSDIAQVCDSLDVKKIVVMAHADGIHATTDLINRLFPVGRALYISPFLFRNISGKPQYGGVVGEPLVEISRPNITAMTASCKRAADIVCSLLALVLLSPVLLAIGIAVKVDSKGPVFYLQERIGYHKRRFNIIKFRTMVADAEANGPSLSSANDPRVTRVGRVLRKYRLDELPQFWNVVKGDMSIVGPRPEREYYVDRIIERVPYYALVHTVRPGITSLGMVKYGYASNVDEMLERLKYDLVYIENISMAFDLKIMLYTIQTVVTGRGV